MKMHNYIFYITKNPPIILHDFSHHPPHVASVLWGTAWIRDLVTGTQQVPLIGAWGPIWPPLSVQVRCSLHGPMQLCHSQMAETLDSIPVASFPWWIWLSSTLISAMTLSAAESIGPRMTIGSCILWRILPCPSWREAPSCAHVQQIISRQ